MPLLFAPAGQKTVDADGIDHRAREDVRTDFRAFFQNDDRELGLHLLQADRGGETRRTRANDHNVEFHRFAFGQFHRFRHLVLSHRRSHPAVVISAYRHPRRIACAGQKAIRDTTFTSVCLRKAGRLCRASIAAKHVARQSIVRQPDD